MLLKTLEADPHQKALRTLSLPPCDSSRRNKDPIWSAGVGRLHKIDFPHPLNADQFHRGPVAAQETGSRSMPPAELPSSNRAERPTGRF
jgi:hypothetical protein